MAGKLLRLVRKVTWEPSGSGWSGYGETCTYDDAGRAAKQAFVEAAVRARPRQLVYDLGCNDGTYSRVAAEHADHVVAVDGDEVTIERLYRSLRDGAATPASSRWSWTWPTRRPASAGATGSGPGSATAADPISCSRSPWSTTSPSPTACRSTEVVAWLASFGGEVVVEFVDRTDPMSQRLLANKPDGTHDAYTLPAFEAALAPHFSVQAREELPGAARTLFHLTPT